MDIILKKELITKCFISVAFLVKKSLLILIDVTFYSNFAHLCIALAVCHLLPFDDAV